MTQYIHQGIGPKGLQVGYTSKKLLLGIFFTSSSMWQPDINLILSSFSQGAFYEDEDIQQQQIFLFCKNLGINLFKKHLSKCYLISHCTSVELSTYVACNLLAFVVIQEVVRNLQFLYKQSLCFQEKGCLVFDVILSL